MYEYEVVHITPSARSKDNSYTPVPGFESSASNPSHAEINTLASAVMNQYAQSGWEVHSTTYNGYYVTMLIVTFRRLLR
jgi:hypothetical protein